MMDQDVSRETSGAPSMESDQGEGRLAGRGEPIAIVGMACKFPGAPDIPAFWRLLEEGGNAVSEGVPSSGPDRLQDLFNNLDNLPGACRYCAYVDEIDLFDAGFFRISPVEAELLDPQQRMMLEVSWRALEDAGIDPDRLKESRTGVYSGISNDEYRMLVVDSLRTSEAAESLYALSGTNLNGTSGRVSFVLGLRGPAKAVDAACASALVSVHDAVADLQQGKADLAIAGGVQAILSSRVFELRAEAMMLSPDGQCKTFDASADGYVRGEGCGVVVLKRLEEAERDGDRIWAVIRGAAVNHGGASVGLTVPNEPALEEVIETAMSDAGVSASEVDYLEAHGTGTAVGDPIEINAVARVFGKDRSPDHPLLVGSVKTNIGHLESAAGIAGLIKAALVMQRGVVPKHLHFNDPDPSLDWDRLPLRVTSSMTDLPDRNGRPRLAGVNSFGISGTNAHIVVEEYVADGAAPYGPRIDAGAARVVETALPAAESLRHDEQPFKPRETRVLPLSGKSEQALRELAERYRSWLDERAGAAPGETPAIEPLLSDVAWTAGVGRAHFDRRAGLVFNDAGELLDGLAALAEAGSEAAARAPAKVAFAYTGQGSQWAGMGRDLYECEPVARAVFDRCEEVFVAERGASLLDAMFGRAEDVDLTDTAWEQPALYALECALTALWASVGVRPAAVMGHSVGEIAAAQAAGVFSLEDGMRFAAARGTLLSETPAGAMAAVFAPPEEVASTVDAHNAETADAAVNISADNGAHQVVSGPVEGIETVMKSFEAEGVRVRRLNTTKAFHSALVEPALDALEASLKDAAISAPQLTLVSNVTGRAVEDGERLDGAYWRRHAREAVAFASGAGTLAEMGVDLILELGPRPVLAPMAASAWPDSAPAPAVLSSISPPEGGAPGNRGGFAGAVAAAYEAGLPIRFEGLFAGEVRRRVTIPGYPFQRERYWLPAPKRPRGSDGLPLLGVRRESAGGEVTYESELFPSDPGWLSDHRVFERVIAPGALYGAMAASLPLARDGGMAVVEDMQLHNPLLLPEDDGEEETGRRVQVVLGGSADEAPDLVRIFSKGPDEDAWTLHIECRAPSGAAAPGTVEHVDLDGLQREMSERDAAVLYDARAATGIDLGPSFRTLGKIWTRPGEALGEVSLPETLGPGRLDVHPLVLDGCFQVVAAARIQGSAEDETTYLPFGWKRLWLTTGALPERIFCHVRMSETAGASRDEAGAPAEVLTGELRLYDPDGTLLGGLDGYTIKRATRAALFAAVEGVNDLLYEVEWRERPLVPAIVPADFLPDPATVAGGLAPLADYLAEEGVTRDERTALLTDMEWWSRSRALRTLEALGWQRTAGEAVEPEELRQRLGVTDEHKRVFRRLLEMLAWSGVLAEEGDGFIVKVGDGDPLPGDLPPDPDAVQDSMGERHPHGITEIGLFGRCGAALPEVLQGRQDPLTMLFSSGYPTPADLYLKAPIALAANRLLRDAVRSLLAGLPADRRLRVIEIGAGTGSATASVLPELPEGRFDYMYTDISAGFFAEAESRFGDGGGCIEYRPLDIEKDPVEQGFDAHGYDLLIASNVLHATVDLHETLDHCRRLLAPSGKLVALENLRGVGWMDLTFGQLDGWWRFDDDYRTNHALASPDVWRRALGDAGFEAAEVLGLDAAQPDEKPDRGVIVASGPAEVLEPAGSWVLVADDGGVAEELAGALAARNQTVLLATDEGAGENGPGAAGAGVFKAGVGFERRESWDALFKELPDDIPFSGVVHLLALDGRGAEASTAEIAEDTTRAGASALAMVQGLADSDLVPAKGVWFVTRGAQVLEREAPGALAGASLWGFGKAVAREAVHLQPRMIDLDPAHSAAAPDLAGDLMYPDPEDHIAYRQGSRRVARLVRAGDGPERLELPDDADWVLAPDPAGVFDKPCVTQLSARPLEPREVRVAVEAAGLNFWDVFRSLGFMEEGNLGREMSGRVVGVGSDVSNVAVGDRVVGLGFGAFAREMNTHEELVAAAPSGISATGLATIPSAFVSAALSFEYSGLTADDRVLIHAGAGGVGLAAIQLVQAAGAEVFATASAPKQAYLRSLGVEHVFDSRTTAFGQEILDATDGAGVTVVLNSLTSEGFIDASLACLAEGGRFVEMARRDILSEEEMAAVRPDVAYAILELDVLKKTDPEWVGRVLRNVMERVSEGELKPIVHSRWPLAEAGAALGFMRSGRHMGKIVVAEPPLASGRLREDRTYLVTGGLGGIGLAVATWLTDNGAGTIVLNGRRPPGEDAEETIRALEERGAAIRVELADVSDSAAVDEMLSRMDRELPPLAGVIHSVGVLSDGALTNQTWDRFETVLWPKMLGAWHLHRATADRDLDLFVLFSSRVGVMGNPGQANHASANAFLDQLAGHRRALGLPGQAIAWGAWSEIGEAAEQKDRIERQRSALGGRWFTPRQGIRAMEKLLRQDVTNSVVMAMDWSVFEEAFEARPPFLEDLFVGASDEEAGSSSSEDLLTQLGATPAAGREDLLVSFLQGEVQAVLRLPSEPASTVGFFDLGMDSLMAVELRNRLNRAFADTYSAPNTLVFDYPTIADLARHLVDALGEPEAAPTAAPEAKPAPTPETSPAPAPEAKPAPAPKISPVRAPEPSPVPAAEAASGPVPNASPQPPAPQPAEGRRDDGIAIVGMACRFPGAPDLAAFWRQLETGGDAVTNGRQDNGSWTGVVGDPAVEDDIWGRGGFIDGIDRFDAGFFGMTPIGARTTDPQQRLLLETSWRALEDAGIDPEGLRGSRTGVYAGIAPSEYRDLMTAGGDGSNYLGPASGTYVGTASSMAVGGVAFRLGLMGPAIPVMLNCAASLVTMQQAVAGLRDGAVDLALVGGVSAVLSPGLTREMAALGMLSQRGHCRTFDAAADGFVRSEGCGMVVLKRLAEAEADGDRIWAVVRGAAVNQNGAAAGPTVPNGPAQERVIEDALAQAGVRPSDVDYLEAHGGASELGDPIEVQAAAAVYGRERDGERPLLIGSVKTNLGHLESAAGVAALIKVVLAMRHGLIPKHLHFDDPNPYVDWDRLPVRVASEATDWPSAPDRMPLAGVSAFGISGTNAHVVVEGYGNPGDGPPGPEGVPLPVAAAAAAHPGEALAARGTRLLPLSGKSAQSLRKLAERYLVWLDEREPSLAGDGAASGPALSDMAWTAGIGRSHFDHRAAVPFEDRESLREGLRALAAADGDTGPVTPAKTAFAYAGLGDGRTGMAEALYASEPAVRTVLDRCEEVFGEIRGASLLDALFGREGSAGDPDDPEWAGPAAYAFECALTALWSSVGVRPGAAVGLGAGALAAAQAAGVFSLEDGLRLASTLDDPGAAPDDMALGAPALTLVDAVSGRAVSPDDVGDAAYWRRQAAGGTDSVEGCAATLAAAGIGAVIEIGPDTAMGAKLTAAWPDTAGTAAAPAVLSSLGRPPDRGATPEAQPNGGFAGAVAGAYEAGLAVSFAGLFAGETRRRVSLPDYPFDRTRYWI